MLAKYRIKSRVHWKTYKIKYIKIKKSIIVIYHNTKLIKAKIRLILNSNNWKIK
jgi:hypothetical protein